MITSEDGGHNHNRSKIKEDEYQISKNNSKFDLDAYKENENKIIQIQSNIRGYNTRKEIEKKKNEKTNQEKKTNNHEVNPNPKKDYPANENEFENGGNNRYFETDKELNVSSTLKCQPNFYIK